MGTCGRVQSFTEVKGTEVWYSVCSCDLRAAWRVRSAQRSSDNVRSEILSGKTQGASEHVTPDPGPRVRAQPREVQVSCVSP